MQIPYSVLHAVREWFFRQACSESRHNLQSFAFWACAVMFRLYAASSNNRTAMARMTTFSQCTLAYDQFSVVAWTRVHRSVIQRSEERRVGKECNRRVMEA